MTFRRTTLVSAVAVALMCASAGVASASVAPPGGGGTCDPGGITKSFKVTDHNTMTVHVTDNAGCSIEAYVHCHPPLGGATYYDPETQGKGDVITTGTTSQWCDDPADVLYGHSGYEYYDGGSWHRVELYDA
jgi:hypothetical protein